MPTYAPILACVCVHPQNFSLNSQYLYKPKITEGRSADIANFCLL